MNNKECQKVTLEGWNGGSINNSIDLVGSVERCGHLLAKWNKDVFGNLQHKIKQKQMEMEKLLIKVNCVEDNIAIKVCMKQLDELVQNEEIL